MIGEVYELAISGRHDGFAHPWCVVLVASNGQSLIVPGFTPGGHAITRLTDLYHRQGIFEYELIVRIDHRHMSPILTRKPLHEADYLMPDAAPIEPTLLTARGTLWGTLPRADVLALAQGILTFNERRSLLDPIYIRELRRFVAGR